MTKAEFLEIMSQGLKSCGAADAADILEEYEQHFAFKLADGYSEEEIVARLGDPKAITAQYEGVRAEKRSGKKAIAVIGLGAADVFFGLLCVLLYAWQIVMGALVLAFGAAAVALFAGIRESVVVYIPQMPYLCAVLLGAALAALAVLTAVGTVYFSAFVRQLMRSFGRFHQNTLATASGKAVRPSLPVYPQFAAKSRRRLRKAAMISAVVFAASFAAGAIACVFCAGGLEFWHIWGWFGYAG